MMERSYIGATSPSGVFLLLFFLGGVDCLCLFLLRSLL